MLNFICILVCTLSCFYATSGAIDTHALNSQQSLAKFSYVKRGSSSRTLVVQSLKNASSIEVRTTEDHGHPSSIQVYRNGDSKPIAEASMEAIRINQTYIFKTSVHPHGNLFSSFGTTLENLQDITPPTVSLDKDVAMFQYNLPRGADGKFYSFCVTIGLDNLPTFIFSGKESAKANTKLPSFMLAYSPKSKTPEILRCMPRSTRSTKAKLPSSA